MARFDKASKISCLLSYQILMKPNPGRMKHIVLLFHSDTNWDWVNGKTKKLMEMEKKDDGEFWMSFKDFCRQFQEVTICTIGPDFDGDGVSDEIGEY